MPESSAPFALYPWIAADLRPLAVPLSALAEDPRNARLHSERNLAALLASLTRFGQRRALVANRKTGYVEAGNATLRCARALGWSHVAVLWTEDDPKEAAAYGLADNRTAELAEWDQEVLLQTLEEIGQGEGGGGLPECWTDEEIEEITPAVPEPEGEYDEIEGGADALPLPFPWFGGKRRVAGTVWRALGDVANYVEPFAGSLAVLLGRPREHVSGVIETVNDKDSFVCNFWRAAKLAPAEVARWAADPSNETDLYARHKWLVSTGAERIAKLEDDPEAFDAQVAGWWVWGLCCWIGGGWCARPEGGRHVPRQRPDAAPPKGVHRQRPHLGSAGQGGVEERIADLTVYMRSLADRLVRVRVCCGDWARVVTDGALSQGAFVGVFLDPPYDLAQRDAGCYRVDEAGISAKVRAWCLAHGDDTRLRIVLCGYEGEHDMPSSWRVLRWRGKGGLQTTRSTKHWDVRGQANRARERLWFSPSCLPLSGAAGDVSEEEEGELS